MIRVDRNFFVCLFVIGQSCQMDLRCLLFYEFGFFLWFLVLFDGLLVKINKVSFFVLFENGVECLLSLFDQIIVVIIDVMVMLQIVVRVFDRFCELVEMVMFRILIEVGEVVRIDFVGD